MCRLKKGSRRIAVILSVLLLVSAVLFGLPANAFAAAKTSVTSYTRVKAGNTVTYRIRNVKEKQQIKIYLKGEAKENVTLTILSAGEKKTILPGKTKIDGTGKIISIQVTTSEKASGKSFRLVIGTLNQKGKEVSRVSTKTAFVYNPAKKVTLNQVSLSLQVGEGEFSLNAKLTPVRATSKVFWRSSDASIVKVSNAGKVTALKAGTATITATANRRKAKCLVTVTDPLQLESVTSTTSGMKLTAQFSMPVKAMTKEQFALSDNSTISAVTWSEDQKTATISLNTALVSKKTYTLSANQVQSVSGLQKETLSADFIPPDKAVIIDDSTFYAANKMRNDLEDDGSCTMTQNVFGYVTTNYGGTSVLLDMEAFQLTGSLTINAPNATTITLQDNGAGNKGGRINGDITINAPNAHVVNKTVITGTVHIVAMSEHSFVSAESVQGMEILCGGTVEMVASGASITSMDVNTGEQVNLVACSVDTIYGNTNAMSVGLTGSNIAKLNSQSQATNVSGDAASSIGSADNTCASSDMTVLVNTANISINSGTLNLGQAADSVIINGANAILNGSGTAHINQCILGSAESTSIPEHQLITSYDLTIDVLDVSYVDAHRVNVTVPTSSAIKGIITSDSTNKSHVATFMGNKQITSIPIKQLDLSNMKLNVGKNAKIRYYTGAPLKVEGISITIPDAQNSEEVYHIPVTTDMVSGFPTTTEGWSPGTKTLTVTYKGKQLTYEITVYDGLQKELDIAASNGTNQVTWNREMTVGGKEVLTIPAGVNLTLGEAGKITVAQGGSIEIYGKLVTYEGDIVFPIVTENDPDTLILRGGSWVHKGIEYQNMNNKNGNYEIAYGDRRGSISQPENYRWYVNGYLNFAGDVSESYVSGLIQEEKLICAQWGLIYFQGQPFNPGHDIVQ